MRKEFAVIVLGMIFLHTSLSGGTFYVARTGNNADPGTLDRPWATLGKANATLTAGDTLFLRGGVYSEQLNPDREGSADNPIVIAAMPGEDVTVEGTASSLIVMNLSSHMIVEGLTIKNRAYLSKPGTVEYWVHLVGDGITMRRCRVIADGDPGNNYGTLKALSRGVVVSGQHITIEHCYIRGQAMGVVIAGGLPRFTVLRFDTLHSHGSSNIVITSHENLSTFKDQIQATLIEDCVIDTSWDEDNIQWEPNYLDHSRTYNNGTIVRRSRLGHAAENCLDFKGAGNVVIDSCLLHSSDGDDNGRFDGPDDIGGAGIDMGEGEVSHYIVVRRSVVWDNHSGSHMYDGYRYYNNVFLNNRRSYRGSNGTYSGNTFVGLEIWNKPAMQRAFVNNIIAAQPNMAVLTWKMDYGGKFYINNNLYYDATGPAKFYMNVVGGKAIVTGIDAWRSVLTSYAGYAYLGGKDQQSVEADPQFVNVPDSPVDYDDSWNFSPRQGSRAIDAGRPVTTALQEGTSSISIKVDDARFFCDGFGVTDGDLIKIGASAPVRITAIDTLTNVLTLDSPRSWNTGDGVHLAFEGSAPDIGAREFVAGTPQAPTAPGLFAPPDGASNLSQQVKLTWAKTPATLTYYPQVAVDSAFATFVANPGAIAETTFTVTSLDGGMAYYWRVRSGNGVGVSAWSPVRAFTTLPNAPQAPKPNLPQSEASGVTTNPRLTWNSVAGALSYRLQLSIHSIFDTIVVDKQALTELSTVVDGLRTGTTYYWRVRATGPGGTSGWSTVATFTTFDFPQGSSGNLLQNSDFQGGSTGWNFIGSGSATFTVSSEGYLDSSGAKITIAKPDSTIQLYQDGVILSPDSSYHVSFAARSSSGNGCDVSVMKSSPPFTNYGVSKVRIDLGTTWTVFSVDLNPKSLGAPVNDARLLFDFGPYASSGDVILLDRIRVASINSPTPPQPGTVPSDYYLEENFPNPFNPSTTIRYSIPRDVYVIFRVFNLLGQQVITLADGFQTAGTHELALDMRGFGSGVYLYVLQAGGYKQTRKLLYVK